jgi:hypothetical protein
VVLIRKRGTTITNLPNEKVMDELFRVQEEMSCILQVVELKAYHCGKKSS